MGLIDSVVGHFLGNQSADKAHDNYMAARANQHQVEVKDLAKAGLNPVLSANSGAGATATPMAPLPSLSDPISSAQSYRQTEAQIDLLKAQAAKTSTDNVLASKDVPAADAKNQILGKLFPKITNTAKTVIDDAPKAFEDLVTNLNAGSAKGVDRVKDAFSYDKQPDWVKDGTDLIYQLFSK